MGIELGAQVLALSRPSIRRSAPRRCRRAPAALRRAGRSEEAATEFEQALALARAIGDGHREASVLVTLGNLRRDQGRMDDARTRLEASLVLARAGGNRRLEGNLIGNLGILHAVQGRLEDARAHFEQALVDPPRSGQPSHRGHRHQQSRQRVFASRENWTKPARTTSRRWPSIARSAIAATKASSSVTWASGTGEQGQLDDALECYEAALAIAREVGDRLVEGFILGAIANILRLQGNSDEAMVLCERALAIHRAVGARRAEGGILGSIGELLAERGRHAESREAFRKGEALLREVGDQLGLVMLFCERGRAEAAGGDDAAARAALAAAEEVAEAMGAGPDSEVGRRIVALRETLA